MADWKTFEAIEAPGRERSKLLRLTISQEFVDTYFSVNRLTPIFQASAHIFGRLPAINLIDRVASSKPSPTLTTLRDAYALYEGVERPHDEENNGDSVLIYVLRPEITIEHHQSMACQARALTPPQHSVLTALVRTDGGLHGGPNGVEGAITRLEWVFAERVGNRMLPKGADKRYGKNHWVT